MNKMYVRLQQTLRGFCLLLAALLFAPSNSQLSASELPVPNVSYSDGAKELSVNNGSQWHLQDVTPLVTNLIYDVVLFPVYAPDIATAAPEVWDSFLQGQLALMTANALPDWPIVSKLNLTNMIIGAGSPVSSGRLSYGVAFRRKQGAPATTTISPSMIQASITSSDPNRFVNLPSSSFNPLNYSKGLVGVRADGTLKTDGLPNDQVDTVLWLGGPAVGIVAGNAAAFQSILDYVAYFSPFNIQATINVTDGRTLFGTGTAAVYTDLIKPQLLIVPTTHGLRLSVVGSPHAVYTLFNRGAFGGDDSPIFTGPISPDQYLFINPQGLPNQFFRAIGY